MPCQITPTEIWYNKTTTVYTPWILIGRAFKLPGNRWTIVNYYLGNINGHVLDLNDLTPFHKTAKAALQDLNLCRYTML